MRLITAHKTAVFSLLIVVCGTSLPDSSATRAEDPAAAAAPAAEPSANGSTSDVPAPDTVPLLAKIPWSHAEIARLFERAGTSRTCELYAEQTQTFCSLRPVQPDAKGEIGRLPAFSIALSMQPAVQESLPRLSKKRVISYLADHVLILQSPVYHDDMGFVYCGSQLGAALCRTSAPEFAMKPEPMIAEAVTDIRTLGRYVDSGNKAASQTHRILVLAFRYTPEGIQADPSVTDASVDASSDTADSEYELIFLHMPTDSELASDDLRVFATSDARRQLHALDTSDSLSLVTRPTIVATVCFKHFKYFGLHPTQPVVTGMRLRTKASTSVQSIRAGLADQTHPKPVSLCQLFAELAPRTASDSSDAAQTVSLSE